MHHKSLKLPVFSLTLIDDLLVISGGGGGGIPNQIKSLSLNPKEFLKELQSYDTGDNIIENLVWCPETKILYSSANNEVVIMEKKCWYFFEISIKI